MAFDPTPWDHESFDATRRMAWLLAVTRLLSPRTADLGRADFIREMTTQGVTLDASRVSRIEAGEYPIRTYVVDAYERVVDVPTGMLQSVNSFLRRSAGMPQTVDRNRQTHLPFVDHAADRIERQVADGSDWLALTRGLTGHEHFYLLPGTWTSLTDQLIRELTRSTGVAFHRRYEAALTLQSNQVGRRQLALSIGRFVLHPDVQSIEPAMALLQHMGEPAAADLVLRLMQDENPLRRRGAARVAGALAARQGFETLDSGYVEHHLRRELGTSTSGLGRAEAVDLASRLPGPAFERVLVALSDPTTRGWVARSRASLELVDPDTSRGTVETIASHAEGIHGRFADDPDRMLRRLLREALFHVHRERRQLAALLLAASPYASGIAESSLALTRGRDATVAALCWPLLRRCGHLLEREHVATSAMPPAPSGGRPPTGAYVALGVARGAVPDAVADRVLETARDTSDPHLARAATFALGMSGHPHLEALGALGGAPEAAARWWQDLGPALHDDH